MKILAVFGTRPEAIKMCPLIMRLREENGIECKICLTGQHKEMLLQVMECFDVHEDYNLEIMQSNQTLTSVTVSILERIEPILQNEKPDIVLVHGDTTTSFATALAAFYQKISVAHVEAGLRTGNKYSPYPEEINRLLTDNISSFHFAPTKNNKQNLESEGICENIYITGNTVIDSFKYTVKQDYQFANPVLGAVDFTANRAVVVTAHRRENIGTPLINICNAIKRVAEDYPDVLFIFPVHYNPRVKDTVFGILNNIKNVRLLDPLDVLDMHNLLSKCYFVMTDSGGLQEEAPYFGKPVLVLRIETERQEAVDAGTVKVVGVDEEIIFAETIRLLDDRDSYNKMAKAVNPYGDGHACDRIVDALLRDG